MYFGSWTFFSIAPAELDFTTLWVPLDFPSLSVPSWSWGSFPPDIRSQCLLHSLAPEVWTWQPMSLVPHFTLFDTGTSSGLGSPRWINGKESTCQCRRHRFNPWVGKIPWRSKWQPIPVLLPGKSHGQRRLEGYSPWISKSHIQPSNWTQCTV